MTIQAKIVSAKEIAVPADYPADPVNHPKHYEGHHVTVECIDIARHMNFQLGNAFKYVWRAGKKGGAGKEIEDLKKAQWYLYDFDSNPTAIPHLTAQTIYNMVDSSISHNEKWRARILYSIIDGCIEAANHLIKSRINELASISKGGSHETD